MNEQFRFVQFKTTSRNCREIRRPSYRFPDILPEEGANATVVQMDRTQTSQFLLIVEKRWRFRTIAALFTGCLADYMTLACPV